jgi:hypothetical protein
MKNYLNQFAVVVVLISNGVLHKQKKAASVPLNENRCYGKFQEMDY